MNLTDNKPDTIEERMKEIEKNFDRINKKQEQIKELEYEKDLIEKELIEKIKNLEFAYETRFTCHMEELFGQAWYYNHNKKEGDIEAYNNADNILRFAFLENNSDFKLTNIISFGYGWAYDFYYKYNNRTIIIRIPMFTTACKNNIYFLLSGYTVYEQVSEYEQNAIISGFDINKIKEAIEEWRKKNEG